MRGAPLRMALSLLCGALALGGCGKGASTPTSAGGPVSRVAPVAEQGAVSVVTRNTTRLGGVDAVSDAAAVARAVYPALTPASRPLLVVLVNEADWHAALAASSLAGAPLGAPILYSSRTALPALSAQTLQALAPRGAGTLGGAQVLRIATTASLPRPYTTRTLPAAQPAVNAAAIERLAHPVGSPAPRQVIVVPEATSPALAMPAAGLAAESGAPILYVAQGQVPAATAAVLRELRHPSIYVLDAPSAGATALSQLRRLGTVSELPSAPAGEATTPAANAIAIARYTDAQFGWGVKEPGHGLVFADAARALDAPAAALLSATGDYGPLLLLENPGVLPAALTGYLANIQPAYTSAYQFRPVRGVYNHGWLIGDEHAISAVTQAEIDSLLEISPRRQGSEPTVSPGE
jgi:hypothetical protein